ncbi:winged helix-turn-helix domain-containing protein [Actinomadura alba]|uniref:Helix-turn-helix transcriptional regulator n=1 Tax=Actinomadura alba TaxID=406431 RepID=A0ABR7LPC0_9ACTN|nr:helix-turn-helix domain-containing protein [Actinomadura alba]MBC6466700.1 helix-turn-helix transcriptional regulator [Actinomadura alba]
MDEPMRKLRDPRELRVLAHPVRLRVLQVLYERGTATATEVAEVVDESPANCSWHLRQLSKHGFVEETGEGKGRQRPWRPVGRPLQWGDSEESGELAAASDELSAVLLDEEVGSLRSWLAWRRTDPPEWQDAANFSQTSAWLTAEELAEVNAEIAAIIFRRRERMVDPSKRPEGARRIRMFAWAFPADPLPGEPPPARNAM